LSIAKVLNISFESGIGIVNTFLNISVGNRVMDTNTSIFVEHRI